MGFGILEPKTTMVNVPGTSYLDVKDEASVDESQYLKKGTGRNAHIILIPQPSNDPNDPLNWPLWQRDLIFMILTACTLVTIGGFGPILGPIGAILVQEFSLTFSQVALLSGYCLCATGAIGLFVAAVCRKYGKRPALIFSMVCAFVGSAWAAGSKGHASFVGARWVQGFSMAFFESVMYSVIGDLYYVHERGLRTAIYIGMFSGLSIIPTLVSGIVAENLGWRWIFWLLTIFCGILLVFVILFGWESTYNRDAIYNVDSSSQDNLHMIEEMKAAQAERKEQKDISRVQTAQSQAPPPQTSYLCKVSPWTGQTYSDVPLWRLFLSPLLISYHPAALWAAATICFPVLWLVGIGVVLAEIFSAPPYSLTAKGIGYLSTGPIVAAVLANLFIGLISDWSIKTLSHRNGGIYEPEFRLFIVIGLFAFSAIGYFLFGYLIVANASTIAISTAYGLTIASCQFSAVAAGTYIVDAYRAISVDVFILAMVVKNFFFFGFTYFVNDWVVVQGPKNFFYTIGGIQMGLSLFTIPMYIYGKKLRAWWHGQRLAQLL